MLALTVALLVGGIGAAALAAVLVAVAVTLSRMRTALRRFDAELEDRIKIAVASREAALLLAKRSERLRALGQIAGGVAHEFNNILQAVTGSLELISHRPQDAAAVIRLVDLAQAAVVRGAVLTRRLLGFAGRSPLHATRLDAADVLAAISGPLGDTLGSAYTLTLILERDLPALLSDRVDLEDVLTILVSNARDAMPDGGLITILVSTAEIGAEGHPLATFGSGRYVCIGVQDGGVGMDAQTLARCAEPFFTTKPFGAGFGLGLSMVKGFAQQSGGGLVMESTHGVGTTATIWLPALANGDAA